MTALRQRLLRDIAELQAKPYPRITLVSHEADITRACLILTPNGAQPLHLNVNFGEQYPLRPPQITIQTDIHHPNVFGSSICASILNTEEGYTPAYTLKGICIQILSFFSSDTIQQSYGSVYSLDSYRNKDGSYKVYGVPYKCSRCGFGASGVPERPSVISFNHLLPARGDDEFNGIGFVQRILPAVPQILIRKRKSPKASKDVGADRQHVLTGKGVHSAEGNARLEMATMPDEILIKICSHLEVEELAPLARAWNRVGSEDGIITRYNIIRNRELICYCLKKSFEASKLGVGVHVALRGRQGTLESEFDLLSYQAYHDFKVRKSVQGLPFEHWIPLPVSRKHYISVKDLIGPSLKDIGQAARFASNAPQNVIYSFMNDVVVKLSSDVSGMQDRSSLGRASKKAIESYYQLFHLLLCLATEQPTIVRDINRQIQGVLQGRIHKAEIPNLGHMLISILISDADMTEDLLMAIIRETIVRNVVWMLDSKGAGKAELAYMEADAISKYRLEKTFQASLTSYRLLMFLNLFRKTINRGSGRTKKTLVGLRDELFDAHGAPPRGTAARLANDIRALQQVDSFPEFLRIMDLKTPSASQFTTFLRKCVETSMETGYSIWRITQERALTLRQQLEPGVSLRPKEDQKAWFQKSGFQVGFFPGRGGAGAGGCRGGRQ